MKIEIFGTGCHKCEKLAAAAESAASSLGIDYEICKVTKLDEIMKRGILMTPGLAVNGEVKITGKVPSQADMEKLLQSCQ